MAKDSFYLKHDTNAALVLNCPHFTDVSPGEGDGNGKSKSSTPSTTVAAAAPSTTAAAAKTDN